MSEDENGKLRAAGIEAHRKGRLNDAVAVYRRLLFADPGDGQTWSNLGSAYRSQGKWAASAACQYRALEIEPDNPTFLGNLGNVLKDLGRYEEALAAHARAVELSPTNPGARTNYGIVLRDAGFHAQALEQFDAAIGLAPRETRVRWDRAMSHLSLGNFEQGWADYEARWVLDELPRRRAHIARWDGKVPLEGKRIAVTLEQGFGDTLLAARFLPRLKALGATVILDLKAPLRRLFAETEGVDEITDPDEALDGVDYQLPIMSLPGLFWSGLEDLPPPTRLTVPDEAREKMRGLIEPHGHGRLKVGVVWSGSVTFMGNRHRAASVGSFIGLAAVPGVQLFSLQKGPLEQELLSSGADGLMVDLGGAVEDFAETAAAVQALDLIVMTDSSVAHLAGSLGAPVWNLLNYVPYWLYLEEREDTPWYPSMRLVRQPAHGDWDSVFAKVSADLEKLAAEKTGGA